MSVDDVAKRLVDYGFHAPTMSFPPVAGTLMVEPTESEDLGELDRFVEAMIAIKPRPTPSGAATGRPTTTRCTTPPRTRPSRSSWGEWSHPYTREQAVYPPVRSLVRNKYWAPVRRIDQAYGDRNLVCSCPPVEAFA